PRSRRGRISSRPTCARRCNDTGPPTGSCTTPNPDIGVLSGCDGPAGMNAPPSAQSHRGGLGPGKVGAMSPAARSLSAEAYQRLLVQVVRLRATLSRSDQQFLDGLAWTASSRQERQPAAARGLLAGARRRGVVLLTCLERCCKYLIVEDETGTVVW